MGNGYFTRVTYTKCGYKVSFHNDEVTVHDRNRDKLLICGHHSPANLYNVRLLPAYNPEK